MTNMTTEPATRVSSAVLISTYEEYVNPQWFALLNLLDMSLEHRILSALACFLGTPADATPDAVRI